MFKSRLINLLKTPFFPIIINTAIVSGITSHFAIENQKLKYEIEKLENLRKEIIIDYRRTQHKLNKLKKEHKRLKKEHEELISKNTITEQNYKITKTALENLEQGHNEYLRIQKESEKEREKETQKKYLYSSLLSVVFITGIIYHINS